MILTMNLTQNETDYKLERLDCVADYPILENEEVNFLQNFISVAKQSTKSLNTNNQKCKKKLVQMNEQTLIF